MGERGDLDNEPLNSPGEKQAGVTATERACSVICCSRKVSLRWGVYSFGVVVRMCRLAAQFVRLFYLGFVALRCVGTKGEEVQLVECFSVGSLIQ